MLGVEVSGCGGVGCGGVRCGGVGCGGVRCGDVGVEVWVCGGVEVWGCEHLFVFKGCKGEPSKPWAGCVSMLTSWL